MTTLQLAQRLVRNLTHTDLATLPVAGALDVQDAINGGLQEFWRNLPATYRTQTISGTLRAPETISVSLTAKYARTLTTPAFSAANDRGCTVRVSDDPRDNEVTGTDTLRDDFLGNVLTGNASLWHDAFQLYDRIERVVSAVRLYRTDGTWHTLARVEDYRDGGLSGAWYAGWMGWGTGAVNTLRQAGTPAVYLLESVGVDQHADSEFYFKVYPMPEVDFIVRFEAEVAPRNITLANITSSAVDLPVRETLTSSVLVPLCEAILARSPLWAERRMLGAVQDAADRALRTLRTRAGDMGLPNNTVGTPTGF
jgi:hypothetical protein